MSEHDKDKIKEILEDHNKKFTAAELIIGIIVILLIGSGIGYAIFKLLSPPAVPPIEFQVQNQAKQQPIQESQQQIKKSQNLAEQQPQNSTQQEYQNQQAMNQTAQTSQLKSYSQTQPGPQIVNPYKKKENTKSQIKQEQVEKSKIEGRKTAKENKQKTKRIALTTTKHAYHYKTAKRIKSTHNRIATPIKEYIIWVSSNLNRRFALAALIKLRKCGHKAFTKEVLIKGKKYTRVYVGPIKGLTAAKIKAGEIKKQLNLKYTPIIKKYDKVS